MKSIDILRRVKGHLHDLLQDDFHNRKFWYEDDVKIHTFHHLENLFKKQGFVAHAEIRKWPSFITIDGIEKRDSTPDLVLFRKNHSVAIIVEIKSALLDKTNVKPENVKEDINKISHYLNTHQNAVGIVVYIALASDKSWVKMDSIKKELNEFAESLPCNDRIHLVGITIASGSTDYQNKIYSDMRKYGVE